MSAPLARQAVRAFPAAPEHVTVRRAIRDWTCPPALAARLYREAAAPATIAPPPFFLSVHI
jgi:hypothetical protein